MFEIKLDTLFYRFVLYQIQEYQGLGVYRKQFSLWVTWDDLKSIWDAIFLYNFNLVRKEVDGKKDDPEKCGYGFHIPPTKAVCQTGIFL